MLERPTCITLLLNLRVPTTSLDHWLSRGWEGQARDYHPVKVLLPGQVKALPETARTHQDCRLALTYSRSVTINCSSGQLSGLTHNQTRQKFLVKVGWQRLNKGILKAI